ncbi:MAG: phosphatase PAP2 family protein, partial [Acidobacteria bacterium]|nr:phosphatase PAP2 family protein [Acidobacteriota bacterium]
MCVSRVLLTAMGTLALLSSAPAQVTVEHPERRLTETVPVSGLQNIEPIRNQNEVDDDRKYELLPGENPGNHLLLPFVRHLAGDQRAFWIAPAHSQPKDLEWIAPFAGVTAAFFAADSWISRQVPPRKIGRSKTLSNYGMYSLVGAGAGSFVLGHMWHDDHMVETGLLGAEAAINSTGVALLLKNITERPRPFQHGGRGTLFKGGSSFPSEHAAVAWSLAGIVAHEYPGTLTKILSYGLATGVSATRVTGQQHFASDAIIGGTLGWYFSRQIYRVHHDTSLGGGPWGDVLPESSGEKQEAPENMGSAYVPLDSWIYPALERLAAVGYVKTAYLGIRPWTRMECARMLEELEQRVVNEDETPGEVEHIYRQLSHELADETARLDGASNVGASLDSIYARFTSIAGAPLRDGYHFGQTLINDYGRPYGEGVNSVDGFLARAEAGPFAFCVRGEFQHAPALASYAPSALKAVASADLTSVLAGGTPEVNRLDLVEGTISATFHNLKLSFGKQSQWLGPGDSSSLLMSNNAEPVMMLKLDNVSPYRVPFLSNILGPMRTEYFLGRLAGHQFEVNGIQLLGPNNIRPQPFLDGAKISFKPTPDLEIGMGFTAQFAGPGLPFTFHNFFRTFFYHSQTGPTASGYNPAKRVTNA